MKKHLDQLVSSFPELDNCREEIERSFAAMVKCYRSGGKVLLCGNGGSAADCEHWSAELMKGFARPRPLSRQWKARLGTELGKKLQGALPAIPLPSFNSLNTAFANDVSPEMIFAQGVWALGKPGDILVGITTSGSSENVLRAVETASAKGLVSVGLTGEKGGKLKDLCDICIRVPGREVHRIQQYHLPVYHCLCLMLEDEFFG